jgi:hypothetical protein
MADIFTSQTVTNLISYTFLALHAVAYDQVLPVFLHHPKQVPDMHNTHLPFYFSGGFGLASDSIGSIFAVYGIACGIFQFLVFPPMCKRFGVLNCFKAATIIFPVVYLITPYTALIQDDHMRYVALLGLMFVKGSAVVISFPCITILLTNSAPSLQILGTLNGFATLFSGIGRALGPALTGAVFSLGVPRGYMIAPWWFLAGFAMMGAVPPWFTIEQDDLSHMPDTDDEADVDEAAVVFDDDDRDIFIVAGNASNTASLNKGPLSPGVGAATPGLSAQTRCL